MTRGAVRAGVVAAGIAAIGVAAHAGETFIPPLTVGDDGTYLRLYGQFDPGLLVVDDGKDTLGYGPVDNGNASTRFGLLFGTSFDSGVILGANYEAEYDPYSTKYVNRTNRGDPDWGRYQTRHAEGFVRGEFGKMWFGQGSMASDGTAEIDLSGTKVVGFSDVGNLAGGQLFVFKDTSDLSDVTVGDAFPNYDGLGRKLRFRYDTPALAGFRLSGSYGTKVISRSTGINAWDVALRYAGEFGAFRVASAAAYSNKRDGVGRYNGSVSVLHAPTGISMTGAAAYHERPDRADSTYVYGKLGYKRHVFAPGATALSVDVYSGSDTTGPHSDSLSWGLQAVQNFDYYRAQVYLGYREYKYSENGARFEPVRAALTGVRVRF